MTYAEAVNALVIQYCRLAEQIPEPLLPKLQTAAEPWCVKRGAIIDPAERCGLIPEGLFDTAKARELLAHSRIFPGIIARWSSQP